MRALSLWQPWASLIADGRKKIETRHWPLYYRGPLAIHAAMKVDEDACYEFGYSPSNIVRGAIVCIVNVDDCVQFPNDKATPDAYGDFTDGRYGFMLTRREVFDPPIPAKGHQGIWYWQCPAQGQETNDAKQERP